MLCFAKSLFNLNRDDRIIFVLSSNMSDAAGLLLPLASLE